MPIRSITVALLLLAGCSQTLKESDAVEAALNSEACGLPPGVPLSLSLADAITNPAAYQGKLVSLQGYYCAGFELSALYETPDCLLPPEQGIWLDGTSPFYSADGRKVVVTGVFDSKLRGHLGNWPAGLCTARLVEAEQ